MNWGRLALIALLAAPNSANAFTKMNAQDCDAVWQVAAMGPQLRHSLSKDGWCLDTNSAQWPFEKVEWRVEGVERILQDGLPPTALAIRVSDSDMLNALGLLTKADAPAMPIKITLTLRQNAQDKQLMIENLQISGPKGNIVTMQGTFYDVDLTSTAKMQFSLGSAKLRDLTITAIGNRALEPYLRPYIGETFPERSRKRSAMIDEVTDWPSRSFPDVTKRAVKQLIASLPAPRGTLRVKVDTGAGLSAGMFVNTFVLGISNRGLGEQILDSTIFHATWAPTE